MWFILCYYVKLPLAWKCVLIHGIKFTTRDLLPYLYQSSSFSFSSLVFFFLTLSILLPHHTSLMCHCFFSFLPLSSFFFILFSFIPNSVLNIPNIAHLFLRTMQWCKNVYYSDSLFNMRAEEDLVPCPWLHENNVSSRSQLFNH